MKNFFKSIWDFFFGSGDNSLGAEATIKIIVLEVLKNSSGGAALASKLVRIIAEILTAVNNKSITDFAGVQALIDKALINIVLSPEESLALGLIISRIKAKFQTALVDAKIGQDFTTATQYLAWVQEEAQFFSTKA